MASLHDLEAAEEELRAAVSDAVGRYLDLVRVGVFSDPDRPSWAGWPTDVWPQIFRDLVIPVLAAQFAEQLRSEGVTDEGVIRASTASFVTQVSFLADDPRIPARVLEKVSRAVAQESPQAQGGGEALIAGLLAVGSLVWVGMIGVVASNAAALAVNSGAFSAAMSAARRGRIVRKTWHAVNDARTRPSHAAVDGVSVGVDAVFTVGGFPLRFPHDPFGPAQEVMECRCVLSFEVV